MTDNTKMREAMIDQDGAVWEKIGGAWSLYKPAQSVPVVGEVTLPLAQLAYERAFGESEDIDFCLRIARNVAALIQPTNSIPTTELERLRKDAERPDCGTCANRGRVNGLSQETFCKHCSWSEKWRKNNYKPIAIQERKE